MPDTADAPKLVICIQSIHTYWDKSSRGGLEAETRNRVPEALKLPPYQPLVSPLSYVTHRTSFSKFNAFAEPAKNTMEAALTEPLYIGGVSLSFLGTSLAAYYQWNNDQGAPPRYSGKKKVFQISAGQWGRILYNGRHVDYDNGMWSYDKWVYNVGLFILPSPSVFTQSEPTKIFSQMAHLF